MPFTQFNADDFAQMRNVTKNYIPPSLGAKIEELRRELGTFPEYQLDFFRKRIVRRPSMRGQMALFSIDHVVRMSIGTFMLLAVIRIKFN